MLGYNMFAYCNNCPINASDYNGYYTRSSICRVAGVDAGGSVVEGFFHGNYSNFDEADLFSETRSIDFNIGKSDANYYYDRIKRGDYGDMLLWNPISYLFGLSEKSGDILSLLYDLITGATDLKYTDVYDPKGRLLYIEEGYHVIMWKRVFLGDSFSATETEYLIYDHTWNLIFNDVISDTYITD